MTSATRIFVSFLIGAFLTGAGVLMAELGGWCSCGPTSIVSTIGGCLSIFHMYGWFMAFPWLEDKFPGYSGLVLPVLDWTLLAFIVLTMVFSIRRRRGKDENVS